MIKYFDAQILVLRTPLNKTANENTKSQNISKVSAGYEIPLRYPKFPGPNELMAENRSEPLPKIRIQTPHIDNDRAKVLVKISDGSLCQYFLRKLPQGWRIYKVRSFENPPNNLYLMKHDEDHMEEYPSNVQFLSSNKLDMKLSEW